MHSTDKSAIAFRLQSSRREACHTSRSIWKFGVLIPDDRKGFKRLHTSDSLWEFSYCVERNVEISEALELGDNSGEGLEFVFPDVEL